MDQFKVENFTAAYPGGCFPTFRHLSSDECEYTRVQIASKLGLPRDTDGLTLVQTLEAKANGIKDASPSASGFVPSQVLSRFRILPQEIYINWYRFDDIDVMSAEDFDHAFQDLWYPSSDDIEIFDGSMTWFLMISHFETLKIFLC